MIKVLIVDDHAVVRSGLRQILSDSADIVVADEASNGQEALNKVMKDNYDVILMDLSMPGRDGLDILQELRRKKPELPVLYDLH